MGLMKLEIILLNPNKFFSIKEVSVALEISRQTLDYHINKGHIKFQWIGKYRNIKGIWVKKYLSRHENKDN